VTFKIPLTLVLTLTLGMQVTAEAQQPRKVWRIGVLIPTTEAAAAPYVAVSRQALRALGYVEGANLALELRYSERDEGLPDRAADLVHRKVDLIMTTATPATLAAKHATTTIPIVMVAVNDPVQSGIVASLDRPGGNVTGNALLLPEITVKQLQLLKEAVPKASRIAIFGNLANPSVRLTATALQESSRALGVAIELVNVQRVEDFDPAFAIMVAQHADGIIAMADPFVFAHMARVMELALGNGLPVIAFFRESVPSGVLMSYGPSLVQAMQRATVYVDKILKGAKPGDLPVEQPTKFELVINLKTAKALGLTIPQSLLLRADQVIQ
jgi:putative ABC transport system substrate-binding protein